MKVYEIVKVTGLGVKECMCEDHSTGLLFHDKKLAEYEADKMWKNETTEEDRKSGWCALHYEVKEREIK